jgi:hypothetical protein
MKKVIFASEIEQKRRAATEIKTVYVTIIVRNIISACHHGMCGPRK